MRGRGRLPSGATIVAWLGTIATLLGIISFFILDLPSILNRGGGDNGDLSQADIISTMSALQAEKQDAQIQLTQIAVANAQAANEATQQALATQAAEFQSTLAVVRATQDAFAATQNAIAAANATSDAATATQDAVGTQVVLDITNTAAAIAQVTPIPTDTPTPTPLPTETAVPPPVSDYRLIRNADLRFNNDGLLEFSIQVADPIADPPPGGLAYIWSLDTDGNPATGQPVQDIGMDVRIAAQVENDQWVGTVQTVQADGTLSDPLYIADLSANGPQLSLVLNPAQFNLPGAFNWVVRAEVSNTAFSFFPESAHLTFGQ